MNRRSNHLTIRSTPPRAATIDGELSFDHAQHLRLEGLRLTGGIAFAPAATDIELIGNEITGPAGIFLFGDASLGGATRRVLIADNLINMSYTGSQATYNGYGIKSIGDQRDITVRDNTIQSVAADYIQTDVADEWDVEGNRFLGPSLAEGRIPRSIRISGRSTPGAPMSTSEETWRGKPGPTNRCS